MCCGEEFGVAARYTELDVMLREAELHLGCFSRGGQEHSVAQMRVLDAVKESMVSNG